MKILMLTRLYKPHVGGIEKHVEILSDNLVKKGNNLTLITEQYDEHLKLEHKYGKVKVIRIPYNSVNSKLNLWKYLVSLSKEFQRADVIHIHDVFWWYYPFLLLFPFKRVCITFHGYEGSEAPTIKAIMQRKISELFCEKNICVGQFMEKWYFTRADLVIYGASKIGDYAGVNNNNKAIFIGRWSEDVGVLEYAKINQYLEDKIPIDFYGGGEQENILKELARKDRKLNIIGWKDNADSQLPRYRYAFVSRYLAMLEGMGARRLVVAIYNNQIKKDYLMCHPMIDNIIVGGSAKELAEKLNNLTKKKEKEMIENCYAWAKEQTWEKLTNQYLELWGYAN